VNEATKLAEVAGRSNFEIYRAKGTTPEIRLGVFLVLAGRRWRALIDEHLRPVGQSAARMEALAAIMNSPSVPSQIDIAKRLRIEGPTMTRMIDSLTADGLVERRPAPGDRRTKLLVLTAKGEAVLEQIFAIVDPLRDRLIAGLTPEQVDGVTQFFADIIGKLDRGLPEEAGDGA
jgi:MarR family transcriptional regulator for hemolysin